MIQNSSSSKWSIIIAGALIALAILYGMNQINATLSQTRFSSSVDVEKPSVVLSKDRFIVESSYYFTVYQVDPDGKIRQIASVQKGKKDAKGYLEIQPE